MPVSQKDIAQRIGVDRTLVAHALRGDPRVAAATRRKVEEVAAEMGYSSYSNMAARSLSGRRFGKRPKIGMVAVLSGPQFEDVPVYEVPFFRPLMQGVEREAILRELDIVLCTSVTSRLPRLIAEQSVDGVICMHLWPDEIRAMQATSAVPILRVGDYSPGEWGLLVQEKEGVRLATRHLLELGHRRIAYLGDVRAGCPDCSARDKYQAFLDTLTAAGITPDPSLIDVRLEEPMRATGEMGMDRLLGRTRDFTGLVCQNDSIAIGALKSAERNGLRIPQDLSVVGFDDVSVEYGCTPALTSIAFDRVAIGQRAVQMIYEQNNAPEEDGCRRSESVPVQLVVRDSTRRL